MEALIEDFRPKLLDSKGLSDEDLTVAIVVGIGACDLRKMPADVLNSFPEIDGGSDETKQFLDLLKKSFKGQKKRFYGSLCGYTPKVCDWFEW